MKQSLCLILGLVLLMTLFVGCTGTALDGARPTADEAVAPDLIEAPTTEAPLTAPTGAEVQFSLPSAPETTAASVQSMSGGNAFGANSQPAATQSAAEPEAPAEETESTQSEYPVSLNLPNPYNAGNSGSNGNTASGVTSGTPVSVADPLANGFTSYSVP